MPYVPLFLAVDAAISGLQYAAAVATAAAAAAAVDLYCPCADIDSPFSICYL